MKELTENEKAEILDRHKWCLAYREKVRNGLKPTDSEDKIFMRYQAEFYKTCFELGLQVIEQWAASHSIQTG